MSRIDDLVNRLCPDGVPFQTVGDVTRPIVTARGVKRQDYSLGTLIPIVDQGQTLISGYTDDESLAVPGGPYIVFGDHTRIVKWVDFTFAPGADGTKVLSATEGVDPRYLLHALSALRVPSRGYNRHWTGLRNMRIPLPPSEVQLEIVRVLDLFQALEAELEAELAARRRQYAYYREALLVTRLDGVQKSLMGEVGEFIRGRRFTKDDLVEDGIPSIHYGEIYTHYGVAADSVISHVREELAGQLRYAQPGDVVIASVGETVEDVAKAVAWLGHEAVAIHDDTFLFRSEVVPKFVAYYLQTDEFHSQKNKHVARGKVKRLSGDGLARIMIPVPPIEEQNRIVGVLDKFDELLNNSIPAEIAGRRQQYEYYRDRLLTFEELAL